MTDDLRAYQAMQYRRRHPIPSAQGRTWRRPVPLVTPGPTAGRWTCTACGRVHLVGLPRCVACGHVRLRPVPPSVPTPVVTYEHPSVTGDGANFFLMPLLFALLLFVTCACLFFLHYLPHRASSPAPIVSSPARPIPPEFAAVLPGQHVPRVSRVTSGHAISCNAERADICRQDNMESAGMVMILTPVGQPVDGQRIVYEMTCREPQQYTFGRGWYFPYGVSTLTGCASGEIQALTAVYDATYQHWTVMATTR